MSVRNDETSNTLMFKIQSGDEPAWLRLVGLYGPLVRYWCRRWGVDDGDLDDKAQEIWMAVGPTLGGFDRQPGRSFRAWLRGVTHHKAQDYHRLRARQPAKARGGDSLDHRLERIEAEPDDRDPGEISQKKALYARALKLIEAEFEERTWKAFMGFAIERKRALEVGAELGFSPAAVRMIKSRVLNRLRAELGDLIE
jgi:RNA polymerase sigma-70 factor (ECF subfamily)